MCLIWSCENKIVSKEFCQDVWNRNNDGWGVLWHHKGVLKVRKGMVFKDFWDLFSSLQSNKILNSIIHFRMATHGPVTVDMAHPFLCHKKANIWMLHNGIVDYPEYTTDSAINKSDTAFFVKRVIIPLLERVDDPNTFIRTAEFNHIMSKLGGSGNRFTFSDDLGHVIIDKDCWKKTTTGLLVSNEYAFSMDKNVLSNNANWWNQYPGYR